MPSGSALFIFMPAVLSAHMRIAEPIYHDMMLNQRRDHGSFGDGSCSGSVGKEHSCRCHELRAVSYRQVSDATRVLL
jgi:hypothetical protein